MKANNSQCLVISDYPIKLIMYRQLLARLGVAQTHCQDWIPDEVEALDMEVDLIVVDMNIPADEEADCLNSLKGFFPAAQILVLQEDHDQLSVEIEQGRRICQMGKLGELEMTQGLIAYMLAWCKPRRGKKPPVCVNG